MRISARNQIKGTIREVRKGATTAHVLVDIGDSDIGGPLITSSITNESVDGLGLRSAAACTWSSRHLMS
jgi:molybdopterin-binding protein